MRNSLNDSWSPGSFFPAGTHTFTRTGSGASPIDCIFFHCSLWRGPPSGSTGGIMGQKISKGAKKTTPPGSRTFENLDFETPPTPRPSRKNPPEYDFDRESVG